MLLVAGVFAIAACGDDDDSASESTAAPSGEATTASVGGATTSVASADPTTTVATAATTSVSSADSTTPSTGGTPSGPGVELLDAGEEGQRVRLPGTAEVGQSAATAVMIEVDLEMEGPGVSEQVPFSMRIETAAEIVEVTDSGYVAETTITNAELNEGPRGVDAASFEQIEGITYRQETSADGSTGDPELVEADQLTAAQRQAFNQFIGQLKTASVAYPSERVGVGARWRSTQPVDSQGFSFAIEYEYELTSIEGDSYTMDVTYDQEIDEEINQGGQTGRMSGRVTGSGGTTGSLTNPLLLDSSVRQDFDVDIESSGQQLAMTMDIHVDLDGTAG